MIVRSGYAPGILVLARITVRIGKLFRSVSLRACYSTGSSVPAQRAFQVLSGMAFLFWAHEYCIAHPLLLVFGGDSPGYTSINSFRPVLYPLLVQMTVALLGDAKYLVLIQLGVLHASFYAAAVLLARLFRNWFPAIVLMGLLALHYELLDWSRYLMTEALCAALVLSTFVCVVYALVTRRISYLYLGGLALVAAILVRPTGYFLVPVFGVAVLVLVGREKRIAICMPMLVVVASLAAASTWSFIERGFFGLQKMDAINLAGSTIWGVDNDTLPHEPELAADVNAVLVAEKYDKEYVRRLRYPYQYAQYMAANSDRVLHGEGLVLDVVREYARRELPGEECYAHSSDRVDALLRQIAVGVIAREPAMYLRHVASQYWYLYLLILDKPDSPSVVIPASLMRAAESIDTNKYTVYHSIVDADAYRDMSRKRQTVEDMNEGRGHNVVIELLFEEVMPRLRNPLRGVFILASIFVPVVLIGFLVVPRLRSAFNPLSPVFLVIAAVVVTVQSHFLLLSLVQSARLRYVTIYDPVLLFLFVFVVFLAVVRILRIRN